MSPLLPDSGQVQCVKVPCSRGQLCKKNDGHLSKKQNVEERNQLLFQEGNLNQQYKLRGARDGQNCQFLQLINTSHEMEHKKRF